MQENCTENTQTRLLFLVQNIECIVKVPQKSLFILYLKFKIEVKKKDEIVPSNFEDMVAAVLNKYGRLHCLTTELSIQL